MFYNKKTDIHNSSAEFHSERISENMDIAQLSYSLAMQNTATAYSFAVMNLSLDTVETAGDGIVKMMETSVNPNIGGNIDIKL